MNEPATQQLLLYRATGPNTFANNTFLNGDYRNMVTFSSSDPQPAYRFIATSDGSQCGIALFPAYHRLFYPNDKVFLFLWPILSYELAADVSAHALPDSGSTNMIASLVVRNQFKLFGFISIYKQLYSNSANAPGTQLPIDGAAGGTDPLISGNTIQIPQFTLSFPIPPVILGIWGAVDLHVSGDPTNFCFVPTASALDVDPLDTAALSAPFVDDYNGDFISRSSAYIAQEADTSGGQTIYNNAHIQFTARNAQWLYDEMESISNTLYCSTECTPNYNLSISGNDDICSNGVYSVSGVPVGDTVVWSSSPSNIVSLSPNGDQVTVTQTGNGNVTLMATIPNICNPGNNYAVKEIAVGVPVAADITVGDASGTGSMQDIPAYYNGQPYYISNSEYYFDFQSLDGHTIYGQPPNHLPSNPPYEAKGAEMLVDVSSGNPNSIYFSVSAHNTCGSSDVDDFTVPLNQQDDYVINPNPASGTITITSKSTNEQYSKIGVSGNNDFIKEVKIYTSSSKIAKQQQFNSNASQVQMDVSSLSPGVYFVEISNGQHTETHKLVISR